MLQARLMFAAAEASPFDVAVLELQERAPGFQPPRLASAFQPGKHQHWGGHTQYLG